jgi:hypothetical protein
VWACFATLIISCSILRTFAYDRWIGYGYVKYNYQALTTGAAYGGVSASATATNTIGDHILVMVNADFKRGSTTNNFLNYKVLRGGSSGTDLATSVRDLSYVVNTDDAEVQPLSFIYLDTAVTTGSVQYYGKVKSSGIWSNVMQARRFDAAVFPPSYAAVSIDNGNVLAVTGASTIATSCAVDITLSPNSATDKVLILFSTNYNSDAASSNAAFMVYRNGVALSGTLQTVGGLAIGKYRQVTLAYVDSPGTTAAVTYGMYTSKVTRELIRPTVKSVNLCRIVYPTYTLS